MTYALQRTSVRFGVQAFDQFQRRFGSAHHLSHGDLRGGPCQTHATIAPANRVDVATLARFVRHLHQMRLGYPVGTAGKGGSADLARAFVGIGGPAAWRISPDRQVFSQAAVQLLKGVV